MLVCHCKAVSERQVRRAVRSGARSRAEVASACQAGTDCGGCTPLIDEIIAGEGAREPRLRLLPLAALAGAAGG